MIRVLVEFLPFGDETNKQHVATATIANDRTGTKTHGNYMVVLNKWGTPRRTWRKGRALAVERKSDDGWELVATALSAALNRDAENVKTSFVPYLEEPEWERAPKGYDWCVVAFNGAAHWANEEPVVVNGAWTVRAERGGKMIPAGHVELPLGVDYRICKWQRPSLELKERIRLTNNFGKGIVR